MEESAGKDLEVKRSGAANDDALPQSDDDFSSSSTLTVDRSSGPGKVTSIEQLGTVEIDGDKLVDMVDTGEHIDEIPKLLETSEPEKLRKNVKFNLRKSLAWDSAFFTSDGVLDADELSTMIEGGEKGVKHQLPGIEEEVCRSMDSISTLASDNLSLDCLEAELFEDIRASIQKSNRPSNPNTSSVKVSSGKRDTQAKVNSSSKKVDLDSGKRPAARIKDNNTSSIPQPKIISRLNLNSTSTLTKRASLSANHAKKDSDTAKQTHVTQKGSMATKTTTQGSKVTGPCSGVPKPSLSSKSSSLKTEPPRPSSSCSNSSSCSSGNDIKTSANFLRKKTDSTRTSGKVTAGLAPKTPSRIGTKNKAPSPANSRLSSHLVVPKLSSSISPVNSVSEWSSESSSDTSTINQSSQSRGSIDSSNSHRSSEGDTSVPSAFSIHPKGRISNQSGIQSVVAPTSQTGSVSRPPAFQPTGLRMPSPKIGFFDGGKSGARTPNGGIRSQSKLPTGPPKTGATLDSPTSSKNSVKYGKLPPPKTTAPHTNMKPNPHKTAPKPSQEQPSSKPKTKTCILTSDVVDHKTESSLDSGINPYHNVDDSTNKQSNLGINTGTKNNDQLVMLDNGSEVSTNEGVVAMKDNKVDKSIADSSRTPFAVKNSVCDTNATGMEVTEKSVSFSFMENQENEKREFL